MFNCLILVDTVAFSSEIVELELQVDTSPRSRSIDTIFRVFEVAVHCPELSETLYECPSLYYRAEDDDAIVELQRLQEFAANKLEYQPRSTVSTIVAS